MDIDLDKTVGLLAKALAFVEQMSREKQIILVGNKKEAQIYVDAATS